MKSTGIFLFATPFPLFLRACERANCYATRVARARKSKVYTHNFNEQHLRGFFGKYVKFYTLLSYAFIVRNKKLDGISLVQERRNLSLLLCKNT